MLKQALKIVGAIVYSIRPSASIGACLLVLAAYQPQSNEWIEVIRLMICTFTGSAYCFLLNDIYDREKDLLNKKYRPIASGALPLKVAGVVAAMFGILFLICAFFFGWIVFLLSILFLGLTSFYSYLNVKSGFLANFVVAFIVAGTQWGVFFIKPDSILIPAAAFLFFISIPREMLLDWMDADGDSAYGKNSLATSTSRTQFNLIMILMLVGMSISLLFLSKNVDTFLARAFFIASIITAWISFIRFFHTSNRKNALFGVRFSHLTFALYIVAMLIR